MEWAGRGAAFLAFLFWGAFFLEHLAEWFLRADGRFPPAMVWVAQALHLGMLAALVAAVVRPPAGAVAIVIASTAFFGWIGAWPGVAAINLLPVVLIGIAWGLRRSSGRPGPPKTGDA